MGQTTLSADHAAPLTRGLKAIVYTVVSLCLGGCVSTQRALTLGTPLETTRDTVSISPSKQKIALTDGGRIGLGKSRFSTTLKVGSS